MQAAHSRATLPASVETMGAFALPPVKNCALLTKE